MIEETRQAAASLTPVDPPRGVLRSTAFSPGEFSHTRLAPSRSLTPWVQHFWLVEWNLRGPDPRLQETLPHPNIHLVFEQWLDQGSRKDETCIKAEIFGVMQKKFSKILTGRGRVFGVKFRPGAFRTFLSGPAAGMLNRVLPAEEVFGPEVLRLAKQIPKCTDAEAMVAATSAFLHAQGLQEDSKVDLTSQLFETILTNSSIRTVGQLATTAGMSKRSLQRLFERYVGATPKQVMQRYRLHEVVDFLHKADGIRGADAALDLGYADQAHMLNDFRRCVGQTPGEYHKMQTTQRRG